MKTKKYIKTNVGYFTVYGWGFRADFNKACALPFPNPLRITMSNAKKWLKENNFTFSTENA
jgi:hypothetical protein